MKFFKREPCIANPYDRKLDMDPYFTPLVTYGGATISYISWWWHNHEMPPPPPVHDGCFFCVFDVCDYNARLMEL